MPDIVDSFDNIANRAEIPTDIKLHSSTIVSNAMNEPFTIDSMAERLSDLQYSLEVKPLTYVDEKKFYSCADAAYKIYEQLSLNKQLRSNAWCIANIAMYSWFFKSLFGSTFTSREVERAVDAALRSPTTFMIKHCLIGTLQAAALIGTAFFGFGAIGMTQPQLHVLSFYVISIIINFIKVYLRIRRKGTDALSPVAAR